MIISVQSQKGGVGKTTLSIHLAYSLSQIAQVLLVDTDPQGSARDWSAAREDEPPFSLMALDRPTIHRDLPKMAKNYDYVVIDGPPRVSELARSAIIIADLVLIPIQPSPYDVWAAQETINLIQEASVFKETLKSAFVINRKIVNTAIGRDVVDALSGYEIPVLQSTICQRIAFAESASEGKTVLETAPRSAAAQEIKALSVEILNLEVKE